MRGLFARLCPANGFLGGGGCVLAVAGVGDAFVKGHDDVRPQRFLDRHGPSRVEEYLFAGDFVFEVGSIFRNTLVGEGEYLEPAGVGENRAVSGHEPVQSPGFLHQPFTGTEVEVIGVTEDDLGTALLYLNGGHGLHGGVGADRHEYGGFDGTMGGSEGSPPGAAGGILLLERKFHSAFSREFMIKTPLD